MTDFASTFLEESSQVLVVTSTRLRSSSAPREWPPSEKGRAVCSFWE